LKDLVGEPSVLYGFLRRMKMKSYITILAAVLFVSCSGLSCFAGCPAADLTGDCVVDFNDFAIMAGQWLNEGKPYPILNGMTWVSISDPGVSGHEGFTGEMSKYETTNDQYCQFLNAALASGDITFDTDDVNNVVGANGTNSGADFVGQVYYYLAGQGMTGNGATNGGAARIHYSGGLFTVDSGFENHPVTYVSWYGARAFCNYYGYRLPTEWEWEAVADYGGSYTYGCGTTINNSIANYWGSTHPDGTTIVGSFGTYGYGMADMAGNVYEWTSSICCDDWPFMCGGDWYDFAYWCSVSSRFARSRDLIDYYVGFRACR
jgi:hypothetical protein